jgi:hypothetical protein
MRRLWLLSLLALPIVAGATTSFPTRANSQDVLGLVTAPLRMMRNLGVHGRVYHRRQRARPAAVSRAPDPRREAARESDRPSPNAGYWADAYDDLIGFAFAPGKDERFWTHGPFDLLTATLTPSATTRASIQRRAAQARAADAAAACNDGTAAAEQAGTQAYQDIETRVQPTAEQRAAFDELRTAFVAASKRINAACAAGYATARPPERLAILADRLSATQQATLMVRTPLEKVYATLNDEQKAALNGPTPGTANCTGDLAAAGAWPGNEIARALSPNEAQQAAIEKLRLTFLGMAQGMASSCPKQPLNTALARLDAAGDRLNTMLYATRVVNRSLNGAYATLDNDQKARLQLVGRQLRLGGSRAADLGAPR